MPIAHLQKGPDRRRSRVKNIYAIFLHHVPETARVRRPRCPLIHDAGRPVRQRPVDNIAVPRNPAHIRRTPVDIRLLSVKGPLKGHVGVEVVAPGGMYHPLWFTRGAAGIENKQQVLTIHGFSGAVRRGGGLYLMPPHIAPLGPLHRLLCTLHHQHIGHTGHGTLRQGLIHRRLERYGLILTKAAVSGDHHLGLSVI